MRGRHPHLQLGVWGIGLLTAGVLVYFAARPAGSTHLFPATWGLYPLLAGATGWAGSLPTFLHALALPLLTAAIVQPATRRAAAWICVLWLAADAAFELGQQPRVAAHLAAVIDYLLGAGWLGERLSRYFLLGTFDPWDLLSIMTGAAVAFVWIMHSKETSHDKTNDQ